MPIESVLTFVIASALLSLSPGPDNLYVLSQSALYGKKSGLMITLGLCTGLVVHTSLVAIGVAALLKASTTAFTILKLSGAFYLVYLAWLSFKAASSNIPTSMTQLSLAGLYRRGIFMNISNPKVSIFFLAFLPQFTAVGYGSVSSQVFLLGCVFIVVAAIIFSGVAILASLLKQWFQQHTSAQIVLNRIAGIVFCLLAINLFIMSA